jgi:hypothetical protein
VSVGGTGVGIGGTGVSVGVGGTGVSVGVGETGVDVGRSGVGVAADTPHAIKSNATSVRSIICGSNFRQFMILTPLFTIYCTTSLHGSKCKETRNPAHKKQS